MNTSEKSSKETLEKKRHELDNLMDSDANKDEILKVSQELDILLMEWMQFG